ncbi:hypothetical protein FUAX_08090 [Fulvitalea axinellae]|uniref:Uncharacterized protein n=1 Tax=Fulvitalea axinellae TaxID=1182444 RepID=A0AAU9CSL9_9BACT|nr:hypothetical protein FUAX_08090 [Fulvitalea axinellae]
MKRLAFVLLLSLVTFSASFAGNSKRNESAVTTKTELFSKNDFMNKRVGVSISKEDKTMTVEVLPDSISEAGHTVIDLSRMDELGYKTRVMRYFGGMLKEDVYGISKLVVKAHGRQLNSSFNRANVSAMVKLFY